MGHRCSKNQREEGRGPSPPYLHVGCCTFPTPMPAFVSFDGLPPCDFVFHSRTMPWGNFPAEKGQLFRLPSALNR